jgi:hypothetical protein
MKFWLIKDWKSEVRFNPISEFYGCGCYLINLKISSYKFEYLIEWCDRKQTKYLVNLMDYGVKEFVVNSDFAVSHICG